MPDALPDIPGEQIAPRGNNTGAIVDSASGTWKRSQGMKVISISRFACSEVRELAGAYIDNELFVEANLHVLRHTQNCRDCREWIAGTARLKSAVQGAVRRLETPAHFGRGLRNVLRGE
jgi:hypothetical protein